MNELSVTHATFTLERTFDDPPARVFAAWADREVKARWFAAGSRDYDLEFRVGGLERAGANLDGKRIGWETLYREIVVDRRIVYTSVLSEDDTVATLSLTTVEFVATPEGGTQLVLVEQGAYLDGREHPQWREQGTAGQLDALRGELHSAGDAGLAPS
ncbi:MAG: SRPBCC domain-containing protein [Actinomycetota bacterium]|nr:SRPBCC domain-containing protein [Actinomycetota bacterium]